MGVDIVCGLDLICITTEAFHFGVTIGVGVVPLFLMTSILFGELFCLPWPRFVLRQWSGSRSQVDISFLSQCSQCRSKTSEVVHV